MNEIPDFVKKYINKFGIPGWELIKRENKNYKLIIVIPAVQEFENLKKLLLSLSENDNKFFKETLIVFAINSIENSPAEVIDDNQKAIHYLKSIINNERNSNKELKKVIDSGLNIGIVDINSPGKQMPAKDGGVGLARKIGMDLALEHFDYKNPGKNILVCLDADCTVQNNYITEIYNYFNNENCGAAYVQFEHLLNSDYENNLAIICYEIFLRYYVFGLQAAGSPYAFHTVGSTMACDAETYIKIQGMNKKKAAEDFYFMEKLSKSIKIHKIISTKVFPSSRVSWRVPFGTGRSVTRFLAKTQNEYLLYSPKCFYVLKNWLHVFNNKKILTSEEYLLKAKSIHIELYNFLVQNNFENSWNKIIQNTKTEEQINIQKLYWFDGFRTLKFIHHLRDTAFPQINMFDALDEIWKYSGGAQIDREKIEIPPIETQQKYLETLRKLA